MADEIHMSPQEYAEELRKAFRDGYATGAAGTATPPQPAAGPTPTAPNREHEEKLTELKATFKVLTEWFHEHVTDLSTAQQGIDAARKLLDDNLTLGAPSEATVQAGVKNAKEDQAHKEDDDESIFAHWFGKAKTLFTDEEDDK